MVVPASITSNTESLLVTSRFINTVSRASDKLLTVDRLPLNAFKIKARLLMLFDDESRWMVPVMRVVFSIWRYEVNE